VVNRGRMGLYGRPPWVAWRCQLVVERQYPHPRATMKAHPTSSQPPHWLQPNAVALASFRLATETFRQVQSPGYQTAQQKANDLCKPFPTLLKAIERKEDQIIEIALRNGI
jgi:hypothetical protein